MGLAIELFGVVIPRSAIDTRLKGPIPPGPYSTRFVKILKIDWTSIRHAAKS